MVSAVAGISREEIKVKLWGDEIMGEGSLSSNSGFDNFEICSF